MLPGWFESLTVRMHAEGQQERNDRGLISCMYSTKNDHGIIITKKGFPSRFAFDLLADLPDLRRFRGRK